MHLLSTASSGERVLEVCDRGSSELSTAVPLEEVDMVGLHNPSAAALAPAPWVDVGKSPVAAGGWVSETFAARRVRMSLLAEVVRTRAADSDRVRFGTGLEGGEGFGLF